MKLSPAILTLLLVSQAWAGHGSDDPVLSAPVKKDAPVSQKADPASFIDTALLQAIYPYYNKPYPKAPGDLVRSGQITVYRPNHGITHGARSAALAADVVDTLVHSSHGGEMKEWLQKQLKADPDFLKKLSLIALAHRTGREDESDSISSPKQRTKELNQSADNFKAAVAKSSLKFSPEELEAYADAIKLDGATSQDPLRSHLSTILRTAHTLDLTRLSLKLDVQGYIPELSDSDVAALFQRSKEYLDATGDERYKQGSYDDNFFKASTDMPYLADTVLSTQKGPIANLKK